MTLTLLGFAGSLRRDSFNHRLLESCQTLLPEGVQLELIRLHDLPLYNADIEDPLPTGVAAFKARVAAADGLVIASPEYNWGMTGVLKNALDWGSRPAGQNVWAGKPVAIFGASSGYLGTVKGQLMTRQVCWALDMQVLSKPEAIIPTVHEKFDASGQFTDERTRKLLSRLLDGLLRLCEQSA